MLPDLLAVSGADAGRFLQAQFTCDLSPAGPRSVMPFAWLTPAGRVRVSGWVLVDVERYYLLIGGGGGTDLARALERYVFRDQVTIQPASAAYGSTRGQGSAQDFLLPGVPDRTVALRGGYDHGINANDWTLAGIRAGVCELPPALAEKFLPQMLNLDRIGGVSFNKGCYPGQEVVARTHNLGKVKRRLARFGGNCPPPDPGAVLLAGDQKVGEVVVAARTSSACELLAVVNTDVTDAKHLRLADDATVLEPLPVPYSKAGRTPAA